MSHFEFNPQERNFPIYGAAERSYPVEEPIDYRLWIVELIYVYSIGKEMILNEEVDQKVFRTAYRQWVAAKNEQALITFHEAGFFRELQWKRINHDKMDEKPIDGWFQFDYVLDLQCGIEKNYTLIFSPFKAIANKRFDTKIDRFIVSLLMIQFVDYDSFWFMIWINFSSLNQ